LENKTIKFLVDECSGPAVARWLFQEGFEVYSVFDENAGISDLEIIKKAQKENWVIITNDKDFGDLIFRDAHPHCGVIFMRLQNERSTNKIKCLKRLLAQFSNQIENRFIVVTETNVRFAK